MSATVEARGLGKKYKRYARPADRLLEWATFGRAVRHEPRWVLRDVNLSVGPGECVGIVGQNGSGKSTLLRILAGVTTPSEGTCAVPGRASALLELGLGFHPDFTGRQNALMAGQIMGLSTSEVSQFLPRIAEFAEIGDYFDEPVRTYSSGMHVRLAFAAATALRPEVLIVDEALAVGDAYFQSKCFARIREFKAAGTSLLFVSHDPGAVKSLCDRALLLDRGMPVMEGTPDEVLDHYNALIARKEADAAIRREETERGVATVRSGNARIVLESVDLLNAAGDPSRAFLAGEPASLRVTVRAKEARAFPTVGLLIRDPKGNDIYGTNTHHLQVDGPDLDAGGAAHCEFGFPMDLGPGQYTLTVALHTGGDHVECNYDWWDKLLAFQIVPGGRPTSTGVAYLPTRAKVEMATRVKREA